MKSRKPAPVETFKRLSPDEWIKFARVWAAHAYIGYEAGELDLREALQWVWDCSNQCGESFRIDLLGRFAKLALTIKQPKYRGSRRPPFPECYKTAVAKLVGMFVERRMKNNDAVRTAREWLDAEPLKRLCKGRLPEEKSIAEWYRAHRKEGGVALSPGPPPRS